MLNHQGPLEHSSSLQTCGAFQCLGLPWLALATFISAGAITSIFFNLLEDQLVTTSIDKCLAIHLSPDILFKCFSSYLNVFHFLHKLEVRALLGC